METYASIKEWKDENISSFQSDSVLLNDFHDQVMLKVFKVAISKMKINTPPCDFAWFITGSGGRFEQSLISDQDHGIIYECSNEINDAYFMKLGEEVSYGLDCAGYPYCKGKIMSSNSLWCKSQFHWQQQIKGWASDESWESIRYLQIVFDARILIGNQRFIHQVKQAIYQYQLVNPTLLKRFAANIMYLKNVISPMGRWKVEQHGLYQGCINLKYAAFLPYVNTVRLLSIKEGIDETSTINRIQQLSNFINYGHILKDCETNFTQLLNFRLSLLQAKSYTDTQYINIKDLSIEDRRELRRIIKDGKRLHDEVVQFA